MKKILLLIALLGSITSKGQTLPAYTISFENKDIVIEKKYDAQKNNFLELPVYVTASPKFPDKDIKVHLNFLLDRDKEKLNLDENVIVIESATAKNKVNESFFINLPENSSKKELTEDDIVYLVAFINENGVVYSDTVKVRIKYEKPPFKGKLDFKFDQDTIVLQQEYKNSGEVYAKVPYHIYVASEINAFTSIHIETKFSPLFTPIHSLITINKPDAIIDNLDKVGSSKDNFIVSVKNDMKEDKDIVLPFVGSIHIGDSTFSDTVFLKIQDGNKSFSRANPFRVSLGGNFDLEKGVKLNSFYGQVKFVRDDLAKICKVSKNHNLHFGLEAGLYQTKSIFKNADSSKFVRSDLAQNLALYASPTFTIRHKNNSSFLKNYSKHKGNFYSKILGHIETLHRNIYTSYSQRTGDTSKVTLPNSYTIERDEFYSGGGIGFTYWHEEYGEFNLQFISGSQWNRTKADGNGKRPSYVFYIFKFSVLETKAGFELGGDVRGMFGRQDHFVSIYFSKTFGLDQFLKF